MRRTPIDSPFALIGLAVVIVLCWTTPLVWPLKMLVVLFHELSHAIMTILTGGQVVSITLDPREGGLTMSRGGWRFLTLSAGYGGSLIWGGAILFASARSRQNRWLIQGLGLLLFVVTLLYVRNLFGIAFCLATGAALWWMGRRFDDIWLTVVARIIGLTSCLYVVPDIWSDTVIGAGYASDARMLADLTHVPTMIWGVSWSVIAVAATVWIFHTVIESTIEPSTKTSDTSDASSLSALDAQLDALEKSMGKD